MEKRTRVTIKDVARAAQVTPQTVSRALRGAPDISEQTRERVLKIASELHYVKNNTATSLRRGSTRLIAVIYDNLINMYFSIMTDRIQHCLKERGYSMLTMSLRSVRLDREAYLSALSYNVDGIISFLEPEEDISAAIRAYHVPVLLLGRRTEVQNVDYIRSDDEEGGRLAANRLYESGCRRLVCLTGMPELTCAYDRFRGFQEGAVALGLDEPMAIDADASDLDARLMSLFRSPDQGPDGVFCFNDMIAFELLSFFERNRIQPVRLIGYDNIQQEIAIPHRLTSVGTDKAAMAKRAADIIIFRAEHGDAPPRITETEKVFLADGITA